MSTMDPVRHYVSLTGTLAIDGRPFTSERAAELLYLLARQGPSVAKLTIEEALYGGYCSRSAVWNVIKKCRDLGVSIHYDRSSDTFTLVDVLLFDVDFAMAFFSDGDFRAGLWVVGGWPSFRSEGSYRDDVRNGFNSALDEGQCGLIADSLAKIRHVLDFREVMPE